MYMTGKPFGAAYIVPLIIATVSLAVPLGRAVLIVGLLLALCAHSALKPTHVQHMYMC